MANDLDMGGAEDVGDEQERPCAVASRRIVPARDHRKTQPPVPAGYVVLETRFQDGEHERDWDWVHLLVPSRTAELMADRTVTRSPSSFAALAAANSGTPAPAKSAAPSAAASQDKLAVDPTPLDRLPERPPEGFLRVWSVEQMRERVRLHNGRTVGDREWRERDQALIQAAIALGPDREVRLLDDAQQQVRALQATCGEYGPAIEHVLLWLSRPDPASACRREAGATVVGKATGEAANPGLGRFPPLLLVGPPGIGKTHFARTLAEALGLPMLLLDAAAGAGRTDLLGIDRRWSNSEPGSLWRLLALTPGAPANPVVVVDEIDKIAGGRSHDELANGLLGLLEPSTARQAQDRCLHIALDASHVNWIFTANSVERIPAALLSRMTIFRVPQPDAAQRMARARAIAAEIATRLDVTFCRQVLVELAALEPRGLIRILEDLGRRAAGSTGRAVGIEALRGGSREVRH